MMAWSFSTIRCSWAPRKRSTKSCKRFGRFSAGFPRKALGDASGSAGKISMRYIPKLTRFRLVILLVAVIAAFIFFYPWQHYVSIRDMLNVQMRMTQEEVVNVLGQPNRIEIRDEQIHWLYLGVPGPPEKRIPGQIFFWVVIFDADGRELGWDDRSEIDYSLRGRIE